MRLRSALESSSRASYGTVAAQCAAAAASAAASSSSSGGGGGGGGDGDGTWISRAHSRSRAYAPARGDPFVPAHFTWSDDPCELVKARYTVVAAECT